MNWANVYRLIFFIVFWAQVIPNIARISRGAEIYTPFAFVSVEDTSKPSNEKLRGQLRIYDLTKGRQVGSLLAEVQILPVPVRFLTIFLRQYVFRYFIIDHAMNSELPFGNVVCC